MTATFDVPSRPPFGAEQATHFVLANGIWQHVIEYGDGDAGIDVVLIPGMTAAAATWDFVGRALPDGVRAFVVDVRGRGLTDHPASGFSLDDYAADLVGVVERLRLQAPILVGHSMGARIAAAFDLAAPGAAGGLVLVDPPLSGPGRAPYPHPLGMYKGFFEIAQAPEPSIAEFRRLEPNLVSDDAVIDRIRWLRSCDLGAIEATHRGFHDEDFHEIYAQITAPAVLVRGAESAVVTEEDARELGALRPDIPVVDVAGAGHLVPHANLEGFLDALRQFTSERFASVDGAEG
ncbi:alpha/beta fold hydrolase [Capillimicrobium parvum]|uniref:N-formylmaleamate deformylase n=1 Tax=Capillimicrobium parvum TaxID=2884022 RepID=A0A9E6XZA2_9ACTN|nr:alpha/beta hydrolase [Capillimicrobium parvum]UGS37292.1 N-formylmaleamate deformylase [Capillimicrobium parvum]